eukprot:711084-Hanusia_phi.AAC.1
MSLRRCKTLVQQFSDDRESDGNFAASDGVVNGISFVRVVSAASSSMEGSSLLRCEGRVKRRQQEVEEGRKRSRSEGGEEGGGGEEEEEQEQEQERRREDKEEEMEEEEVVLVNLFDDGTRSIIMEMREKLLPESYLKQAIPGEKGSGRKGSGAEGGEKGRETLSFPL